MRLLMRVSILICAAGGTETAMLSSTKKKRGVLVLVLCHTETETLCTFRD